MPEVVHVRGDPAAGRATLERLRAKPLRLEHRLVETDVLRQRRASLVADVESHPGVDHPTVQIMRWASFVLAPVVVNAAGVALLHADHPRAGPVDALDRDVLWEFARGFGVRLRERAGLQALTLRRERHALRDLLKWLEIRSEELTDSLIELAAPRGHVAAAGDAATTGGLLEAGIGESLLTPRELEILRLMSEGRTNRSIADELVTANGTVKFHVHHILRKLHVANRAQAVSTLLGAAGRARVGAAVPAQSPPLSHCISRAILVPFARQAESKIQHQTFDVYVGPTDVALPTPRDRGGSRRCRKCRFWSGRLRRARWGSRSLTVMFHAGSGLEGLAASVAALAAGDAGAGELCRQQAVRPRPATATATASAGCVKIPIRGRGRVGLICCGVSCLICMGSIMGL